MKIKWEEPSKNRAGRPPGNRAALIAELRRNPGRWAVWEEKAKARSLAASAYRALGIRFITRKNSDGSFKIYARYETVPESFIE